jgi:CubicO group peptidase (beta-lactamase class C family)
MNLAHVEATVREGVADGVFPGACFAFGRGHELRVGAVGSFTYATESRPVTLDVRWDLASLTKVLATTTAAMRLEADGLLTLDSPVRSILPGIVDPEITIRQLLTHTSGLIPFRLYHNTLSTLDQLKAAVLAEPPKTPPGTATANSDLNMLLLQWCIEAISGQPLDGFCQANIWNRLELEETGFKPTVAEQCAPTEPVEPWRLALRRARGGESEGAVYTQGEVHDPTAMLAGGVAGHAGLFSSVGDVALFAIAVLENRLVPAETWERWTRRQSEASTRALGWDTVLSGTPFGPRTFGHTGFTGTSIWIDPDSRFWAVLLSNLVHPTAANAKIIEFRRRYHAAVWESIL